MLPKTIWPTLLILAALAGYPFRPITGRAELPPTAYEKFQADAPESLIIKVLDLSNQVAIIKGDKVTSVELKASVSEVNRTATNLKPGANITIIYTVTEHRPPWAGPGRVTIPRQGDTCPAYLGQDNTGEGHYRPAAGGYTFRKLR